MTAFGVTFMVLSVGFVVGLCYWCFAKVLSLPAETE